MNNKDREDIIKNAPPRKVPKTREETVSIARKGNGLGRPTCKHELVTSTVCRKDFQGSVFATCGRPQRRGIVKDVNEMEIEECVYEVCPGSKLGLLLTSMDGANDMIRKAGWVWEKTYEHDCWMAWPDKADQEPTVFVEITDRAGTDLWRLTVLVYRAKDST